MDRHRRRWTEGEDQFLEENRSGHTIIWLSERLGRKPDAVKRHLYERHILKYKTRLLKRRDAKLPEGFKYCRGCGLPLSLDSFAPNRGVRPTKDGRQSRCRKCQSELAMKWNREHPDRFKRNARASRLRRKYGLSVETYDALLLKQEGKCPICLRDLDGRLHVDHDHQTGRVRGIVHGHCNTRLGAFGDSVEQLQRAINYLSG